MKLPSAATTTILLVGAPVVSALIELVDPVTDLSSSPFPDSSTPSAFRFPGAADGRNTTHYNTMLQARRVCTGDRNFTHVCKGHLIGPKLGFQNCRKFGGNCCAKTMAGFGGIDIVQGKSCQHCGYCFSGACQATYVNRY